MSESNNVKFLEAGGKWLWKRYDEQGSVTFRSPEFDTERQAREDYDVNGGEVPANVAAPEVQDQQSAEASNVTAPAPEPTTEAGNTALEGEMSAGTSTPSESETGANQTV